MTEIEQPTTEQPTTEIGSSESTWASEPEITPIASHPAVPDMRVPEPDFGSPREFERVPQRSGRRGRKGKAAAVGAAGVGVWLLETVLLVGLAFILAFVIRNYLIEPYRVPTGSMLPTIQLQDHILANKAVFLLGGDPHPGDIVVFDDFTGAFPNLVKRVIAVGGETIDFTEEGYVMIDGIQADEPYVHDKPTYPLYPDPDGPLTEPIIYPFTIPEGTIWVMGDNRTNSADSRAFGPVPLSDVKGRAFFTYWPWEHFAPLR